jgi:flagella basal body P-ring formation protein FlgA
MNRAKCFGMTALLACTLSAALEGFGAELQVRARCQPRGPIVTLGDVAEVTAADAAQAEKLTSIELFPAPPPSQQRTLRARELQDLLANRGIGLAEHRLSGSSQVIIGGFGEQAHTVEPRPVSSSVMKRAERAVGEAIVKFLQEQASADDVWQVDAKLTDAQARLIPVDGQKISVRGGQPPWSGAQKFELTVDDAAHPASYAVTASVSQLARVVVAAKAIGRGDTIRSTDLRLQRPEAGAENAETFHAIDDVAGMEAAQAIPAGAVLQRSLLRSPIMVRRGEVITVYSRTAGIRIRVTARAREDAALGELVAVESLSDRKAYTARVSGLQEAEVYARAMQSAPLAPSDSMARSAGNSVRSHGRSKK